MEFVETDLFSARMAHYLSDDEYRQLQAELIGNPKAGALIPGTGGLRKLRWGGFGRGKRGGLRIIYYCWMAERLLMIYIYRKSEQELMTLAELRALRNYIGGTMR